MPDSISTYVNTTDLVDEIKRIRSNEPHAKIAFCFTGGGARGAYEAGALEALFQVAKDRGVNVEPDILAGASVGAIIAFMHWAGRIVPHAAVAPYVTAQSSLWQSMATGNRAGETLFKGGWIVPYVTGKTPIPVVTDLFKTALAVQSKWRALQADLTSLNRDLPVNADTISKAVEAVASNSLIKDFLNLADDALKYFDAVAAHDRDSKAPSADPSAVIADVNKLGSDVRNDQQTVQIAASKLRSVLTDLPTLVVKINAVMTDMRNIVSDGGALAGNAARLDGDITLLLTLLDLVLGLLSILCVDGTIGLALADTSVAVGAGSVLVPTAVALAGQQGQTAGPPVLGRSLLGVDGLRDQLVKALSIVSLSMGVRPIHPDDFVATWAQHQDRAPQLYLVGANLTRERATVFAVGSAAALQSLAQGDFMTVDLARTNTDKTLDSIFTVDPAPSHDNIIRSVLTSSAIPFAFPFQTWTLQPNNGKPITQDIVDGGLIDDTPIDVAVAAGANYVFSFELTPLLQSTVLQKNTATTQNMLDVLMNSLQTAMDASLRSRILGVVNANATAKTQIPVYRLAPLVDGSIVTPTSLNFDGSYDKNNHLVCNLEDWFMQGYRDVKQLRATSMAEAAQQDQVFHNYQQRAENSANPSGAVPAVDFGRKNAFFRALTEAFPTFEVP